MNKERRQKTLRFWDHEINQVSLSKKQNTQVGSNREKFTIENLFMKDSSFDQGIEESSLIKNLSLILNIISKEMPKIPKMVKIKNKCSNTKLTKDIKKHKTPFE
jgi:hypothetical protein